MEDVFWTVEWSPVAPRNDEEFQLENDGFMPSQLICERLWKEYDPQKTAIQKSLKVKPGSRRIFYLEPTMLKCWKDMHVHDAAHTTLDAAWDWIRKHCKENDTVITPSIN